jgi:uncharacterized zinc-type alcohol dehydrogenase-like protein
MVKAYAAMKAGGSLEPFEYELGPLGPNDIDIEVEHCGICHTDLSMLDNDWGLTSYPFVGGHEVIGKVAAAGDRVTHVSVGDRVGLGAQAGYCMTCAECLGGHHNTCTNATSTIIEHHGGFAEMVRASGPSAVRLPDGLDPAEAGPLFCGGITVFSPLVDFDVRPTDSVAVLGIGGLGHLALKFARAWGCHVTAFTSSGSKTEQALEMGAHETIDSRDGEAIAGAAGRFDLILSTVNVKLDWNAYMATLKPRGRLHFLGVQTDPLELEMIPMLFGRLSVSASPVGSPQTIADMLEFCRRHDIQPITEHFPFERINDAMQHLRDGKARYRIVLDH